MSAPISTWPVANVRGAVAALERLRADLADAAQGAGRTSDRGIAFTDVVGVIDRRLEFLREELRGRRT